MKKILKFASILSLALIPAGIICYNSISNSLNTNDSAIVNDELFNDAVEEKNYNILSVEEASKIEHYALAISAGYTGKYADWIDSITAKEIELKEEEGYIYWHYSDGEWSKIYNESNSVGDTGESAYQIYVKYHPDYEKTEDEWFNDLVNGALVTTNQLSSNVTKELEYVLVGDSYYVSGIGSDIENTSIVVPSSYNGKSVVGVKEYAFYYRNDITSIELPNTVSVIENNAFMGCSSLKKITTSANTFMDDAFYGCSKLEEINYNNTLDEWMKNSFLNEEANPMMYARVINMKNYLGDYFNFNSPIVLDIPNTTTSLSKYTFLNFDNLINVVVPNSVEMIDDAVFKGCIGLKSITLPFVGTGDRLEKNSLFGSVFGNESYNEAYPAYEEYNDDGDAETYYIPSKLESVIINGNDAIGYGAFSNLSSVKKFKIDSIEIGKYAFKGCNNIKDMEISESIKEIGDFAFSGMTVLKKLDLSNVEVIGNHAFENCTELKELKFSSNINSIGEYAFKGCDGLEELVLPEGLESVGDFAFSGITKLSSVTIPSTCTEIGEGVFQGASKLESITLKALGKTPTSNESNDSVFGYLFGDKSYTGSYAANQEYASGKTVTYYIPQSLTNVVVDVKNRNDIPYGYFDSCKIKSLEITDDSTLTSLNTKSINATLLTSLNTGSLTCSIENELYSLLLLKSLDLSKSETPILSTTFNMLTSLNNLVVGDSIKEIGVSAFINCTSLESIDLQNVEVVGANAFKGLANLTTVKGSKINNIGEYAFNSTKVTKINSSPSQIGKFAFANSSLESIGVENIHDFTESVFANTNVKIDLTNYKILSLAKSSFENCPNVIGDLDLTEFTGYYIPERAFMNSGITSVNLPSKVTSISDSAFNLCKKLEHINLENIRSFSNYALANTHIKEVKLYNSLYTLNTTVFENVSTVEELYTGGYNYVSGGYNGLPNCNNLKTLTVGTSCEMLELTDFPNLEYFVEDNLKYVNISDGKKILCGATTSVTDVVASEDTKIIANRAFFNDKTIKSLTAKNCTVIGRYSFYNSSIEEFTSDTLNGVCDSAFKNCLNLASIDFTNVRQIYICAFENCQSLTIDLVTDANTIDNSAFHNSGIKSLKWTGTSLGDSAFSNCKNLAGDVYLSNCTKISSLAFENCEKIVNVSASKLKTIEDGAFTGCTSLQSVSLSAVTKIGNVAFRDCTSLTNANLSNIDTLGYRAFYGCKSLKKLSLPAKYKQSIETVGAAMETVTTITDLNIGGTQITNGKLDKAAFALFGVGDSTKLTNLIINTTVIYMDGRDISFKDSTNSYFTIYYLKAYDLTKTSATLINHYLAYKYNKTTFEANTVQRFHDECQIVAAYTFNNVTFGAGAGIQINSETSASLKNINSYAFYNSALHYIDIYFGANSITIELNAFNGTTDASIGTNIYTQYCTNYTGTKKFSLSSQNGLVTTSVSPTDSNAKTLIKTHLILGSRKLIY